MRESRPAAHLPLQPHHPCGIALERPDEQARPVEVGEGGERFDENVVALVRDDRCHAQQASMRWRFRATPGPDRPWLHDDVAGQQ
jgi:hypothetical protein